MDINDVACSGKPNEAFAPEIVKQVLKIVMNDRNVKHHEIGEMRNTSAGSACKILQEKLGLVLAHIKQCCILV